MSDILYERLIPRKFNFVTGETRAYEISRGLRSCRNKVSSMEELVTANGTTTALRAGSGPDLVLVHSLLTDRDAFQAVAPELAECFRVTLLNLPGFHGSRPVPGAVTDYELWLAHACDDLGVRPDCIVCGSPDPVENAIGCHCRADVWTTP